MLHVQVNHNELNNATQKQNYEIELNKWKDMEDQINLFLHNRFLMTITKPSPKILEAFFNAIYNQFIFVYIV